MKVLSTRMKHLIIRVFSEYYTTLSASNIAYMSADGITLATDLLTCRRSAWQLLAANLADHNLADDQLQLGNLVCI